MRHNRKSEKFSRSRAQRKALIRSLVRALIINERIVTTESKAKAMRTWGDKLITWGKEDTVHHRRLAFNILQDRTLVKRLFDEIAPRFKEINGGYTRVIDKGIRKGDGALMSFFELTKLEKKVTGKGKKGAVSKKEPDAEFGEKEKSKTGILSGMKKMFKKDKKKG